ncbi:MAG: serine/threonine-protein kinase [Pseudanabaenaceae cyanobacterium SKYGB_i_bin29]|nr:serine/threonine protein kinase [Pseudanabaenaceae cyanobacterium SKYG29]MDW8420420.1 serine/threonine-protein kinase [Pseudanabaenaceae cyanobacterium SKYGB_i_bin29]
MIGKLLDGRYQVIKLLGRGGFGHTYLATDTKRPGNPPCVVKHLRPQSTDPEFLAVARRLFKTEAETLERLGSLEQVPTLYAYFEEDKEFYLVQEFIDGHPLSNELVPNQPWEEPQVIEFLQNILPVLAELHDRGVIHRDIKPDNIIRRKGDRKLVLIDFGAVKQVMQDTGKSHLSVAIGTPGYIAPEQAIGKPKFASGVYAVGMVAIQALRGVPPDHFGDTEAGEVHWHICVDTNLISPRLIVKRNYRQRYRNAREVLSALQGGNTDIQIQHRYNSTKNRTEEKVVLLSSLFLSSVIFILLWSLLARKTCTTFADVSNVPAGVFNYGGSTTWDNIRREMASSRLPTIS